MVVATNDISLTHKADLSSSLDFIHVSILLIKCLFLTNFPLCLKDI